MVLRSVASGLGGGDCLLWLLRSAPSEFCDGISKVWEPRITASGFDAIEAEG